MPKVISEKEAFAKVGEALYAEWLRGESEVGSGTRTDDLFRAVAEGRNDPDPYGRPRRVEEMQTSHDAAVMKDPAMLRRIYGTKDITPFSVGRALTDIAILEHKVNRGPRNAGN